MADVELSVVSGNYDRIQGIKSGEVRIDGYKVRYQNLAPPQTFQRLFDKQEFDIAEMSFCTYLLTRTKFKFPYTPVPVFLSRVFPHCSIYVRDDRGIKRPEDLKGRLVGAPGYAFTRGLCVRGMLADEYGVRPEDIRWLTGGIDTPGGLTYIPKDVPPGLDFKSIAADKALGPMLAAGEIDAIITYRDPQVFTDKAPHVARLFPDFRRAEQGYYKKTGIFPIMHMIGIRDSLIARDPDLPVKVMQAFEKSKALALPHLVDLDALAMTLPWMVAEAEETIALMGKDFWPYGVEKNVMTLSAQTRWIVEQKIIDRVLKPEEIFPASVLEI
jgi:4,5-dihydroxyphthalate decarboxylase